MRLLFMTLMGFRWILTEDFAREKGLTVDTKGFEQAMARQRERARKARQDEGSMQVQGGVLAELDVDTRFIGYTSRSAETQVVAIIHNHRLVEEVDERKSCFVLLKETPFYAESGGQVGDRGEILTPGARLVVEDVKKGPRGEHIHQVRVEEGTLHQGDPGTCSDRPWIQGRCGEERHGHPFVAQSFKRSGGRPCESSGFPGGTRPAPL